MLEYMKKPEYVSGRIVELDISKAMEIPELSEVEYEILEPGYCPNVPVGEIYLVTDSHENGLQIYVNREVESLPYVSGLDVSGANKKYENAGFKVLYFGTNSGYACDELALDDFCRVISEKYIKEPEEIIKELPGKTFAEAGKLLHGAKDRNTIAFPDGKHT